MNLLSKAARKAIRVPMRLFEHLEAQRKRAECVLGSGARLHPPSRIGNSQGKPQAITVGARSEVLGQLVVMGHGGAIHIGESCFVGEGARIWSADSIHIGDRVLISHGVNIHDHNSHSLSAGLRHEHFNQIFSSGHPSSLEDVASEPILIDDDAWIGFNATILKGVTIGRGAVIGAASLVTGDVPAFTVVVGNPARVVGRARS